MATLRAAVATLLLSSVAAGSARAQEVGVQRVAVLRLDFEGDIPEAGRELLASRLVEGLAVARFEVFGGGSVAAKLKEAGIDLATCGDGSCHPAAAKALGVSYLVAGKVSGKQKTYDIRLELVNGRTGASSGQRREHCELCGLEEAAEKMGLAASSLRERLEALAKGPARFIIRSRPAGVAVLIDGKGTGTTPLDTELPPGAHQLRLGAEGYEPSERSFVVVSGVDETLDIDLVPLPERFPFKALGWTGLAVGIAAVAAGVVAVAVDGREVSCSEAEMDAGGHCPYVRNTSVLGASLIGVGAAATVGGVISLYLGSVGGIRPAAERATAWTLGARLTF